MGRPTKPIKDDDIINFIKINSNCNCPDIARQFGINRKSAHKRIQKLQKLDILQEFNGLRKNVIRFKEGK